MPPIAQVTLNTVNLDRLIVELYPRAHSILDKAAFDVERIAKPLAHFDTGAMRSSIYVSGAKGGSTFSEGASEAQARRPGVVIMPEVKPRHEFERIIGASVEYGLIQELTFPYLTPAVEQVRPQFETAWKALCQL